ncbi:hypothetical protein MANES_18G049400v8 [Manihot esculenta]|uniref:Uncharacterized protein n=1 Tax=Manihot esculenta TaxID=3983 RepID=A0A251IQR0_MANES|nr:hypothetical protein MANES_18G049400v8 [Manihot esculenta]
MTCVFCTGFFFFYHIEWLCVTDIKQMKARLKAVVFSLELSKSMTPCFLQWEGAGRGLSSPPELRLIL